MANCGAFWCLSITKEVYILDFPKGVFSNAYQLQWAGKFCFIDLIGECLGNKIGRITSIKHEIK
jgi:hypothetical protein